MSSHNHGFATHRYLDVMTVRPSQGARVAAKVNATMSPPAMNMMDLPTEQTGRHLSAIDSTKDHIRLQTESSQRYVE